MQLFNIWIQDRRDEDRKIHCACYNVNGFATDCQIVLPYFAFLYIGTPSVTPCPPHRHSLPPS